MYGSEKVKKTYSGTLLLRYHDGHIAPRIKYALSLSRGSIYKYWGNDQGSSSYASPSDVNLAH